MNAIERVLNFYDQRSFREKLLLVPLSFVFWYLLYNYLIITPIDTANEEKIKEVSSKKTKIDLLNKQLTLLMQLKKSNLYQEWHQQQKVLTDLQKKYNEFTKSYSPNNSQQIVNLLLTNKEDVNILEIKNLDTRPYQLSEKLLKAKSLYQKPYIVTLLTNYENFYNFLKRMELVLRNVQWNRLTYNVSTYPEAKVEVEFSILYEKI